MSDVKSRFESAECDVLHLALKLLEAAVVMQPDLPRPSDNMAENLLYWMSLSPEITFQNPTAVFKYRTEDGHFNPTDFDEGVHDLPSYREPMDDAEFFEMKERVKAAGRIWCHRSEAKLSELWQNAYQIARIEICRAENERLRDDPYGLLRDSLSVPVPEVPDCCLPSRTAYARKL